jgi:cell division transport system permease protein
LNFRAVEFQIIETITNIRRNALMTLAAMTTAAACLFFLGAFSLAMWNVRAATQHSAAGVRIEIYCTKATTVDSAKELGNQVRQKCPDVVKDIEVLSPEQLLEDASRWGVPTEGYESEYNPFGPVVEVSVSDPAKWEQVVSFARGDKRVDDVRSGGAILDALASFQRFGRIAGIALVVLLCFASLLTISNTIRLTIYARRREIRIMQIVGATAGFIRAPFIMEGVIQGTVGGTIATAVLLPLYCFLGDWLKNNLPAFGNWIVFGSADLTVIFGGLIVLGGLFGAVGSWISVRRYLE